MLNIPKGNKYIWYRVVKDIWTYTSGRVLSWIVGGYKHQPEKQQYWMSSLIKIYKHNSLNSFTIWNEL